MSGIVGILNSDGVPLDRALLQRKTEFLAYRGPDAQQIWTAGPVGLGHALLRTTHESASESQPTSLEGRIWITADARMDGRTDLIQELSSKGRTGLPTATDAELILHAYAVWGEQCVQHLLGDFAFAIWDGAHKRLFCARDHFGIKPFYYAQVGDSLIFSNTLNCVRLHPAVSNELNDLAIADFLLFDFNQEPSTTAFTDIHRLPPAHFLTWSEGALRVERYWTLPIEGHIHYKRGSDYVDRFQELLRSAVEDRMRTDSVGVFMSGGLDSTTVAATAKQLLPSRSNSFDLRAYTAVFKHLVPDHECKYTSLVAEALGIPVEFLVVDNYKLFDRWDEPGLLPPEPTHNPLAAITADQSRQVAARHRVALTGYGGDPSLSTSVSYHCSKLLKSRQFAELARDLTSYLVAEGRFSRLYIPTRLRLLFAKKRWRQLFPEWLNQDLTARLDLRARWEQLNSVPAPEGPLRPVAYQSLTSAFWPVLFEGYDPGVTRLPLEARYPFFDLRLLRYLLRLPPLPWCADKELLRRATRGTLPEAVRLRPKDSLARDPVSELVRRSDVQWLSHFHPEPAVDKYVDWSQLSPVTEETNPLRLWAKLRVLSLNFWLRCQGGIDHKRIPQEVDLELDGPARIKNTTPESSPMGLRRYP
jgi:asparagine synthase (glutamine-hydrolysing)